MARAGAHSCVEGDVLIEIRKSGNGDDAGGAEPKGPDCPGGSYAVREGHTSHRQDLHVKRASTGYRISGTRPRSRKSSCKGGLARLRQGSGLAEQQGPIHVSVECIM